MKRVALVIAALFLLAAGPHHGGVVYGKCVRFVILDVVKSMKDAVNDMNGQKRRILFFWMI